MRAGKGGGLAAGLGDKGLFGDHVVFGVILLAGEARGFVHDVGWVVELFKILFVDDDGLVVLLGKENGLL